MTIALQIKKKREKRGQLVTEAKGILDKAKKEEDRALTPEEDKRFDAIHDEADSLVAEIEGLEKQLRRSNWLDDEEKRLHESGGRRTDPDGGEGRESGRRRTAERRELRWKLGASGGVRSVYVEGDRATSEYREAYDSWIRGGRGDLDPDEQRALNAGVSEKGGFLLNPMEMAADLIKAVDDLVFLRQFATVDVLTSAASLGIASLDSDPDDADWTSEIKTGTEDSDMSFGQRVLEPHPLAKRIKVSETLLRMTSGAAETLVRERLAYKFGITEEKAYLTGDGVNKPLGLFTASADGIPTGRDISEDNTSIAFTADGLINAKYALKAQYMSAPTTRWLFHRDAIKRIRKLKDGEGNYIWRAGLESDRGDTILDVPYVMSEYVPNTFTAGAYVGLIGDLRFYRIVDALSMMLKRLDELYAETNQVGFIGRKETDGMPVLAEAFSRVTLGT